MADKEYIVSEIEYTTGPIADDGDESVRLYGKSVHSDLDFEMPITNDHRAVLHAALDEWLDHSNGTGCFYVSEQNYIQT